MTSLLGAHQDSGEMKVTVFGSGSFGMAMATLVARNGHQVAILTRRPEVAEGINQKHRNPAHLASFELLPNITASTDAEEVLRDVEFIVHCVPLQATESFLQNVAHLISPSVRFISTSKGLHTESLEMMHELVDRCLPSHTGGEMFSVFSGPTFAQDLMAGVPSGAVCARASVPTARECANLFQSPRMRVWPCTDVVGVEVGGAVKNVFAILAGVAEGLGFGANAVALLVTRGCREMNKLAMALGAEEYTMNSLSGIGDLMLTCMGGLSRNKAVGLELGRGKTLDGILRERAATLEGVAEGVATTPAAVRLAAKHGIEVPLIKAAAEIILGERRAIDVLEKLMTRPVELDCAPGQDESAVEGCKWNKAIHKNFGSDQW